KLSNKPASCARESVRQVVQPLERKQKRWLLEIEVPVKISVFNVDSNVVEYRVGSDSTEDDVVSDREYSSFFPKMAKHCEFVWNSA
ncbi:hypothetical protein COCON_G00101460, partial [Conger conger]